MVFRYIINKHINRTTSFVDNTQYGNACHFSDFLSLLCRSYALLECWPNFYVFYSVVSRWITLLITCTFSCTLVLFNIKFKNLPIHTLNLYFLDILIRVGTQKFRSEWF